MGVRKKESRTIATYRGLWAWPIMRPRFLQCLKATATRVLRRFSRSSAHPRPGLGLEVGIIGRWGYGVRAGSKRRSAVQGGSVFVAKLGHAGRWRWRTWG